MANACVRCFRARMAVAVARGKARKTSRCERSLFTEKKENISHTIIIIFDGWRLQGKAQGAFGDARTLTSSIPIVYGPPDSVCDVRKPILRPKAHAAKAGLLLRQGYVFGCRTRS